MNRPKKLKKLKTKHPFVSICTPTFNRRPFISSMIDCFNHQDYPKNKMEWIIIDDGTDKIGDLVKDIPQVRYYAYDEQMVLGKKRNLLNKKAKGDIIIYMDDDDYQSPKRVSHSVQMLKQHPSAYCAGSSIIHIYFKHISQMYQFGPYGPNHATAGTFAFRKELLDITSFEDDAALAEEKHFLKNYTIPFVQLDSNKTILVVSHNHNTFDKKKLLENINPIFVKKSDLTADSFIKDENLLAFYMDYIDPLLENYKDGAPELKPEVLRQQKIMEDKNKDLNEPKITLTDNEGNNKNFNAQQIANMLNKQTKNVLDLQKQILEKEKEINNLKMLLKENNINIEVLSNEQDANGDGETATAAEGAAAEGETDTAADNAAAEGETDTAAVGAAAEGESAAAAAANTPNSVA